ncbi:MAG: type II toxin-antitoxin system VapC family toxin [Thermomicrobiales bacterium]
MPIVVDTSVALKWVLAEVYSANANALRRDCLRRREQIVAPTLLLYEATNTLYGAGRDGTLPWQSIEQGLDDMLTVVRLRAPNAETVKRAVEIARLTTQTYAYDTQFLVLAERLRCDLWTADERFLRAMQRQGFSQVKALSAYPLSTP